MSDTGRHTAESGETLGAPPTLYDAYLARTIDQSRGRQFLPSRGDSIFARHVHMNEGAALATLLGSLIRERLETPLVEVVGVFNTNGENLDFAQSRIACEAVSSMPEFLGVSGVTSEDWQGRMQQDSQGNVITVHEALLPERGYVSTHVSRIGRISCQVLLTPTSVIRDAQV